MGGPRAATNPRSGSINSRASVLSAMEIWSALSQLSQTGSLYRQDPYAGVGTHAGKCARRSDDTEASSTRLGASVDVTRRALARLSPRAIRLGAKSAIELFLAGVAGWNLQATSEPTDFQPVVA